MLFAEKEQHSTETSIKSEKVVSKEVKKNKGITLSVDCVIFGFDKGILKILTIESDYEKYKGKLSLLGDLVSPDVDLDKAAVQVLKKRTSLSSIFLEQVHTYGTVKRHPAGRVVTVAYCALVNINHYKLKVNTNHLQWMPFHEVDQMAFDHLLIANDCLGWLRTKLLNEPIAFNLLPKKFSLRELQELYTAILGEKLDRRNFRKKIQTLGYLKDLNELEKNVTHRPGKLYKFDPEKYQKAR
jgi:8-oxo-dGTP diphosphatase